MPSPSVPISLETPLGVFEFNASSDPTYARVEEFTLTSAVRSAVEAIAGRDGSIVPDAFRSGATPILKGVVTIGGGAQVRDDMMEALVSLAVSTLRADGVLRWTPRGQARRRLVVRCLEDPQDGREGVVGTFQLAFVARTAYTESDDLVTASTASLVATGGGGFSFPFSFPLDFGPPSSGGSVVVTNLGDTDTWPVVRVYGPISGPAVRVVGPAQVVSLSGLVLNDGDFAEIDMAAGTILYNGAADFSLIGTLDPLTSDFFSLAPGSSTVVLSGAGFSATSRAEIAFRHAFARG